MNARCPHCLEPIAAGERTLATDCGQVLYHRECLLRMVVGSVGHLEGRCSCFGGTEDDPPGMTARQAAAAAVELFASLRLPMPAASPPPLPPIRRRPR